MFLPRTLGRLLRGSRGSGGGRQWRPPVSRATSSNPWCLTWERARSVVPTARLMAPLMPKSPDSRLYAVSTCGGSRRPGRIPRRPECPGGPRRGSAPDDLGCCLLSRPVASRVATRPCLDRGRKGWAPLAARPPDPEGRTRLPWAVQTADDASLRTWVCQLLAEERSSGTARIMAQPDPALTPARCAIFLCVTSRLGLSCSVTNQIRTCRSLEQQLSNLKTSHADASTLMHT